MNEAARLQIEFNAVYRRARERVVRETALVDAANSAQAAEYYFIGAN